MLLNVGRAQRLMNRDGLDGLVASGLENCFYSSGLWNEGQEQYPYDEEAYVVMTRDDPAAGVMVVGVAFAGAAVEVCRQLRDVIPFGRNFRTVSEEKPLTADERRFTELAINDETTPSAFDALVKAIELSGLSEATVGIDERGANPSLLDQLAQRYPKMHIRPAFQLFREIRMVKTDEEIRRLVKALHGTEQAILAVGEAAAVGVTEKEMHKIAIAAMVAADCLPLWAAIRFGRNMALSLIPSNTPLLKGDYIFFDVGCTYEGYRADIGRIYAVGEPSDKLVKLYNASKEGQTRAFELLTPGRLVRDVFEGACERVREAGIPHYQRRHIGHGIGIEWYDQPILTPESTITIEQGMTLEVETPYYEVGFGGTMIEDTVLVTDDGVKNFTSLDRDLRVLQA
jgi:Xaa-Pro aminopeptidase